MSISGRLVVAAAVVSLIAPLPARAQDATCRRAPTRPAARRRRPARRRSTRPRIIGAHGPEPRTLFGPNDLVIISAGTAGNVHVGQRYYVRAW